MAAILAIVFLVVCVVCAFKESKVTGLYKTFGVYGRIKAYLALDFVMAGLMMPVMGIVGLVGGEDVAVGASAGDIILTVVFGLVILAAGVWLYLSSYRKCPDVLKKKCIPSMILSGFGVAIKVCIFFLGFVWALTGPKEMVNESGADVYVLGSEVFDGSGTKIGDVNSDGQSYTPIHS